MKLHRFRMSIRTQLMVLVLLVALSSLAILAIVTGIYFTATYTEDRAERLEVIAQLKASQLEQSFQSLYYQVSLLRSKDTIENALTYRKAGNESTEAVASALSTIQQLMDSSNIFNSARLYDIDYNVVGQVDSDDPAHNISSEVLDSLYILTSDPPSVEVDEKIGGPALSGDYSFMSITMSVTSNSSVLISSPDLTGYLSLVMNIDSFQSLTNITGQTDYSTVNVIRPDTSSSNYSKILGFYYIFQPNDVSENVTDIAFSLDSYAPAPDVFIDQKDSGSYTSLKNPFSQSVALGYSVASLQQDTWLVTVEQSRSQFTNPTTKLTKIIVGICFGIAIFMTLITFPLAHYGVRPIITLQKATESMTERRGLKKQRRKRPNSGSRFSGFGSSEKSRNNMQDDMSDVNSNSTGSATGARFRSPSPMRDPESGTNVSSHNSSRNGSIATHPSGLNSFDHVDFHVPSVVQRRGFFIDELNELTEAFNAMTTELDKQYTHLEDRVKERTKELEVAKIQADAARAQAEAANEAKTVFIANISHELRTPLNGILGMTAVAMAENSLDNIQSSLDIIFRSGELLLHILTQLLTFSKNQLDKSKLENRQFQIIEVASQVKSIFGKTAKDQKVDLSIIVKPNSFRKMIMFGDSNRLIQVIMNLVSNSLKFTPVNGSVTVSMKIIGEYDEEKAARNNFDKAYVKQHVNEKFDDIIEPADDEDDEDHDVTSEKNSEFTTSLNNADLESIHTISSRLYKRVLAESYNFTGVTDDKSSEDKGSGSGDLVTTETTVAASSSSEESDPSSTEIAVYKTGTFDTTDQTKMLKYHKFKNAKKWVLQISVTDTGTGIDESLQEKVFEAFVQGDQTLSRSYGGTGLGLSICKQFSKMMNGTLTLKSKTGENSGSTFTFTIPLPQVGEIIVSKEREEEMCHDEFNENYNRHKKVTFLDNAAVIDSDNSDPTPDDPDSPKFVKPSFQANDENNTFGSTHDNSFSAPVGSPSGISEEGLASYFDKPELLTRMSTGTAHSIMRKSSAETSLSSRSIELNRSPNVGCSTATATPPLMQGVQSSSSVATADTVYEQFKHNFRFLVAEDNLVNQEVIKRMLNLEGFYNITLACDGSEAISILKDAEAQNQTFDLIFMDVQMPNIDGLTATRIIRQGLKYTNPIVALTAFADKSNEDDCIEAGMTGFLSKPVRRPLLRNIIKEFCLPKMSSMMNVTASVNSLNRRASSSSSNSAKSDDSDPLSPGHQRRKSNLNLSTTIDESHLE